MALSPNAKRTLILITASTAVGFLGDVATYSVAASKGGKFRIAIPKGKELAAVLVIGVVGGFLLDAALRFIETSLKSETELALDKLVSTEREKIIAGSIKGTPTQVLWAPPTPTT